jgi:hypothetical protein
MLQAALGLSWQMGFLLGFNLNQNLFIKNLSLQRNMALEMVLLAAH